jgi:CDP-glucose 4,6-dehydratase
MKYLITGHTGFKGSWLAMMLKIQGHEVSGISLDAQQDSIFRHARLSDIFTESCISDIRNFEHLRSSISEIDPDVIIHLAAQPLVQYSYQNPLETFEVNVIGTINVLEASKTLSNLRATLVVTTDKVYKNTSQHFGYKENDKLGGDDPYSASKAAADLSAQSWAKSFASSPLAIARAGNVIGGGDWAPNRLIPDLVRSYQSNQIPEIRNPFSVRPWQHVLDCLNGYVSLIDHMLAKGIGGEWNFGPDHSGQHTVADVINVFATSYGVSENYYNFQNQSFGHEAEILLLDSTKSRTELGWFDRLDFDTSVRWTADWYRNSAFNNPRELSFNQLERFLEI